MDLYLTEAATGYRLGFAMLPSALKASYGAQFMQFDIIGRGEVKIPRGTKLTGFTWSGTLPGKKRLGASFIKSHLWVEPKEVVTLWDTWAKNGAKLKLMLTESPINHDVVLSDFTPEFTGGYGDCEYTINLVEHKDLFVYTVNELNMQPTAATNQSSDRPAQSSDSSSKTYTVKPGDSFWRIAQQQLGDGTRYEEVAKVNSMTSQSVIHPGDVLTLP